MTITDFDQLADWIRAFRPDVVLAGIDGELSAAIVFDPARPDWGADWEHYLVRRMPELIRPLLEDAPESGITGAREKVTVLASRRGHTIGVHPHPPDRGSPSGGQPEQRVVGL